VSGFWKVVKVLRILGFALSKRKWCGSAVVVLLVVVGILEDDFL